MAFVSSGRPRVSLASDSESPPHHDPLNSSNMQIDVDFAMDFDDSCAPTRLQHIILTLRDTLQTAFNSFGLCHLYPCCPSFEPNKFILSSLLAKTCPTILPLPYPFPNMMIYRLMTWMNFGSNQKSETKVQCLVKDVLQADDFDTKHLEGFSVRKNLQELDRNVGGENFTFPDDWIETSVNINIPMKLNSKESKSYTVPQFYYQPLVELYTSDAWLEAQDNIQKLPKEPGCSLERIIAGLMFFSDATHLANFRTAKAWPLYLYFGNLTKYV
ncbi:hypothetical protein BDR05DRAFT_977988 [Suillus weaverae]|nr:hypothetical protein BDR05DRAFT_977988 [Suillus weaverae]